MALRATNPSRIISEGLTQRGERLPLATALPILFGLSALLWSIIAAIVEALV